MHPGNVFNAKVLRSVHDYPRIGLCKRNSLDAGTTRLFVPALTSTERIWRHTRHVRFGSKADISACPCDIRFTPKADIAQFTPPSPLPKPARRAPCLTPQHWLQLSTQAHIVGPANADRCKRARPYRRRLDKPAL